MLSRAEEAGPDGTRLAFEVSEQYPVNWSASMPIVLEALKETPAKGIESCSMDLGIDRIHRVSEFSPSTEPAS